MKTDKVSRLEVIDENSRVLVLYGQHVRLSFQDDDRTLKVFIKPRKKEVQGE